MYDTIFHKHHFLGSRYVLLYNSSCGDRSLRKEKIVATTGTIGITGTYIHTSDSNPK